MCLHFQNSFVTGFTMLFCIIFQLHALHSEQNYLKRFTLIHTHTHKKNISLFSDLSVSNCFFPSQFITIFLTLSPLFLSRTHTLLSIFLFSRSISLEHLRYGSFCTAYENLSVYNYIISFVLKIWKRTNATDVTWKCYSIDENLMLVEKYSSHVFPLHSHRVYVYL